MDHEPMRRVAEFRTAFGGPTTPGLPDVAELRRALLAEEAGEAADALSELAQALRSGDDPAETYRAVAKELADVLYVTYGAADALSIDLPAVFAEVHRSNMSKVGADGSVVRRADGKVLKGPAYRPPALEAVAPWPPPAR